MLTVVKTEKMGLSYSSREYFSTEFFRFTGDVGEGMGGQDAEPLAGTELRYLTPNKTQSLPSKRSQSSREATWEQVTINRAWNQIKYFLVLKSDKMFWSLDNSCLDMELAIFSKVPQFTLLETSPLQWALCPLDTERPPTGQVGNIKKMCKQNKQTCLNH